MVFAASRFAARSSKARSDDSILGGGVLSESPIVADVAHFERLPACRVQESAIALVEELVCHCP